MRAEHRGPSAVLAAQALNDNRLSPGTEGRGCVGVDFSSFESLEDAQAAASKALEQQMPENDGARSACLRNIQSAASIGQVLAECFESAVETTLQQPTFVLDFPVEISPLAKPHRTKPGLVERFELYIAGETNSV